MRVLVFNIYRRRAGGVETYLAGILPALAAEGHDVAVVHELDEPAGRDVVFHGTDLSTYGGGDLDARRATTLARARAWRPDLIVQHSAPHDPRLMEELATLAPVLFFAHDYAGACISGLKTWQSVPTPCQRALGPMCLLHYYPHRCGGLNPLTLARDWATQRARQAALREHPAVMVTSGHLRDEMLRQGVREERLHAPAYFCAAVERQLQAEPRPPAPRGLGAEARLLFVGRVDRLKGLGVLLDALPAVLRDCARPVRLVVAGDGPALEEARARAARLPAGVAVEFHGWCDHDQLAEQWRRAELLVVPSVWPEPFGQVGPEAGAWGVPAVAFAVGGVASWLVDGENGLLVPAEPPAPGPLAAAIVDGLADEARWEAMRQSAWRLAARFRLAPHVQAFLRVATQVAHMRRGARGVAPSEGAAWHGTGR